MSGGATRVRNCRSVTRQSVPHFDLFGKLEISSEAFGPNAAEVGEFLAELRGLDWDRAIQVWEGRAAALKNGYGRAFRSAEDLAVLQRRDQWLLAREAASAIAGAKLGVSAQTGQVLDVLADVAGAISIRDLLSTQDFELLLLPWTWRGQPRRRLLGGRALLPAAFAIVALIAVGTVLAALSRPKAELAVAGPTESATATAASVRSAAPVATSLFVSPLPLASPSPVETVSPTPAPRPRVTAAPIRAPAPTPAPTRAPTRTPTPTPRPMCTVISLLGLPTVLAQQAWSEAGFGGTVTFSPDVPPHYVIKWQSRTIGASIPCTRSVTVSDAAP
jgi:hypothetical protein